MFWQFCLRVSGRAFNIYQIIPKVLECTKNESEDRNKFIVCVFSPLEYIRITLFVGFVLVLAVLEEFNSPSLDLV